MQRLTELTMCKLEHSQHMQSIEVIRPDREDGRIKLFRIGKAPLPMHFESLRKCLRYVEWFAAREK